MLARQSFYWIYWILGLAFLVLSGCSFRVEKEGTPGGDKRESATEASASPGYAEVRARVLEPRCESCHSVRGGNAGEIGLESYPAVVARLRAIRRAVFETRTMPKDGSLSSDEAILLRSWLDAGAPEFVQTTPLPTTPPVPGGLSFSELKRNVFTPRCGDCHEEGEAVDLFSVTEVRKNLDLIIDRVFIRRDMPPRRPLEEAELRLFMRWLREGESE